MYIYKTTNLINGKVYIGKSEKGFTKSYLGSGVLLSKAIKKYGKENFEVELIEECDTLDTLNDREKFWISEHIGDNCYNIAEGGTGGNTNGNHLDKELIYERVSSSLKGRDVGFKRGSKHTDITKSKISKANSGSNNGNYNREFTKKERMKMSNSHKKRYQDPAERAKCNVFKNLSEEEYAERCKKWSDVKKGPGNGRFKHDKKIAQLDKKTNEIIKIWEYSRLLDYNGFNSKYARFVAENKPSYKSHKGYLWKYVD